MFHVKHLGALVVGMGDDAESSLFIDVIDIFLGILSLRVSVVRYRFLNREGQK